MSYQQQFEAGRDAALRGMYRVVASDPKGDNAAWYEGFDSVPIALRGTGPKLGPIPAELLARLQTRYCIWYYLRASDQFIKLDEQSFTRRQCAKIFMRTDHSNGVPMAMPIGWQPPGTEEPHSDLSEIYEAGRMTDAEREAMAAA